jgi:hypothetical protein
MSKRLQVVLREADLERYERSAKAAGLTLSEWARQAMTEAERHYSSGNVEASLPPVDEDFVKDLEDIRRSVGPPVNKWPS